MEKKIVFGRWEATFLLSNLICTKIFLNFPREMAEGAGSAGWLLAIYISIIAFFAFFIISRLYKPFEGKNLFDISEFLGGTILRIIVGASALVFAGYIVFIVLREFGENMKIISLNNSPISFVILFFIVGMVAASYFGLEALMRMAAIIPPIISIGFLIVIIAVAPDYDFANITPIFGNGIYNIFGEGFMKLSVFSEFIFILLIVPFIGKYKDFKVIGYSSLGLSSALLIVAAFCYISVFPYPTSTESFLPFYQLSRLINYGRFFQRLEAMFVIIWASAALVYLSAGFFAIVYLFKKTFDLEYYKPLIPAFAVIIYTLSFFPANLITAINLETKYFRQYSWIVAFGLPIAILFAAGIKKKRLEKASKKDPQRGESGVSP